ncbi:hypothetical protein GCM10009838_17020 [Catenulispora subtropica]|uniref:Small integral membrane protein n=1 Tax=Catenulispora subtropica TaxID=450798 RepID=A0ABP5CE14_9ACTN
MWNTAIGPDDYEASGEKYQNAVLEQYKLCVTMSDNLSARRNLANTFFLTLNSGVVAVLAAASRGQRAAGVSAWVVVPGFVILLAECLAWFVLIHSYKQLNAAKFAVINTLEERLPAFAYVREWEMVLAARGRQRYPQLTWVEKSVPLTFAAAYLVAFLGILL